jgi:hypothetical protein
VSGRLFNDELLRNGWNADCGVDEHRNGHGENAGAPQANSTLKCAQQAMAVHLESPFVSFMPLGASLASMQSDQANFFLFPEKYPPLTKIPARSTFSLPTTSGADIRSPLFDQVVGAGEQIRSHKPRGPMPAILELLSLANKAGSGSMPDRPLLDRAGSRDALRQDTAMRNKLAVSVILST